MVFTGKVPEPQAGENTPYKSKKQWQHCPPLPPLELVSMIMLDVGDTLQYGIGSG